MNNTAPFDIMAREYDEQFTDSLTGREQRRFVRKWLTPVIAGKTSLSILEINCGTGGDALWLASLGHRVTGTDQSAAMIDIANRSVNANHHSPVFITCAFSNLATEFKEHQFDLIFSNFSGLNCVLPENLPQVAQQLHRLLKPGGHLAAVIFGKYCLWETAYYLSKARVREAFRRRNNHAMLAHLKESTNVPIFYYSANQFSRLLRPLKKLAARPVGLFIPPSYLEAAMKKHPRLLSILVKLEEKWGPVAGTGSLADHVFLLFKKNM